MCTSLKIHCYFIVRIPNRYCGIIKIIYFLFISSLQFFFFSINADIIVSSGGIKKYRCVFMSSKSTKTICSVGMYGIDSYICLRAFVGMDGELFPMKRVIRYFTFWRLKHTVSIHRRKKCMRRKWIIIANRKYSRNRTTIFTSHDKYLGNIDMFFIPILIDIPFQFLSKFFFSSQSVNHFLHLCIFLRNFFSVSKSFFIDIFFRFERFFGK